MMPDPVRGTPKMKISLRHVALFGLVVSLSACSGGGGGGGNNEPQPPDPDNIPPVVSAGADRTVNSGAVIQLEGSASDSDGSIVDVEWVQASGVTVVLQQSDTLTPSFEAPVVNQGQQVLVFTLTATDNGNATASDSVSITLTAPVSGAAPVIQQPIATQRANAEDTVTLTATATDDDGEISAYNWTFTGSDPEMTPALTIDIDNNNDADPAAAFNAPNVDVPTRLFFELEVEDNGDPVNTATATTSVLVYPLPKAAEAAQLYVSDGAALISRFNSTAAAPTEFATDASFGRFDPGAATLTIDGPFALTVDGRLIQSDNEEGNPIQEVCAFPRRAGNGQYSTDRDRGYSNTDSDSVENYGGIAVVHGKGYTIVIDTFAGDGSADARALHVYGSAVSGDVQLVADIPLGSNGRDLLYDESDDRLFVSLDNARIAVFNDFIAEVEAARNAVADDTAAAGGSIPVDALIAVRGFQTPSEHDFRGLAYHRESDRLIVSDIGYLTSAEHPEGVSDGAIIILSDATEAARSGFGALVDADAVITGVAGTAQLGDPTDIALNGRDLIVADKANGRVYVYDNIFGGFGARSPAPADDPLAVVGATYLAVRPLDTPNRPHVNDLASTTGATVNQILALRQTDDGGQDIAEVLRLQADLAMNIGSLPRLFFNLAGGDSVRGMGMSVNGDLYVASFTPDSDLIPILVPGDPATTVQVLNSAATNRLAIGGPTVTALRDRAFTLSGAEEATSSLVIDEFGVLLVTDGGDAPGITVHTVCGDGALLGGKIQTNDSNGNAKTPTDVDYDGERGDLYLSFADGSIGIYRAFNRYLESLIANPDTPNTPNTLLVVTPQVVDVTGNRVNAAADYQAIEYLSGLDQIALLTQGSDSDTSDGKLLIIGRTPGFQASGLFGGSVDVDVDISGPNTGLGNPVDLAFDGVNLFVAEKGNGLVLRFDNASTLSTGDVSPTSNTSLTGVEELLMLPDYVAGNPDERSE